MKIFNFIPVLFFLVSMVGAYSAPGPNEVFDWVAYPEAGNPELVNPAGFSFLNSLRLRIGMAASDSAFEGIDRV